MVRTGERSVESPPVDLQLQVVLVEGFSKGSRFCRKGKLACTG